MKPLESLASHTGKVMHAAADAFTSALNTQQAEIEERDRLIEKLQRALAFWLPCVPGNDAEVALRAGDDAFLLSGFGGPQEQSAEELGWVKLRTPGTANSERDPLLRYGSSKPVKVGPFSIDELDKV